MDRFATHSCHLLQQLHNQRIQGLLCDCMLVVKGVSFKAHKNVLAAFSQYFRTLFQSSPTQKNDVFHLDIKNIGGIGQILDYMYTSHLDLSRDNVQTLLGIAESLQVQNVLNLCHSFLKASRPVEQPASLACNDTYALQSALADGTSGESYEANLFHVSSSAVPSCKVLEDRHPGPQLQALHSLSADTGKEKRDSPEGGGPADLPLKQINGHYKLRNFSSKPFCKQAASPTSKGSPELPFDFVGQGAARNALCDVPLPDCAPGGPDRSPPPFLGQPLSECLQGHDAEGTSSQPAKQLWLKKAIRLRKLSFPQSEKPPAQPSVPPGAGRDAARGTESEGRGGMGGAAAVGPEGEQASCEGVGPDVGPESPQGPSEPGSQVQLFLVEKQYPCASCGKAFKHPSNLELHLRSHTGEKPFECNICGKCFSQAGNLQTHLRRHSGEKPYICEICGKRFAASGDVQRHIIIHTGEKPHLCDICGRGFSNFSNLKEHKKNHAVEKVFTCDECGKSFNLPRKLVKHRIRHSGERPYNCSACGKSFARSGDLRRHIRTHTGEKPYNCETCNKCFSRSAVLRRHRNTHCKVNCERASIAEEFSHTMGIHGIEKSPSPDFFNQEMSVTFLPASVKFPPHPTERSPEEFDHPAVALLRASPVGRRNHHKPSSDPVKLSKPQQRPDPSCSFKEIHSPPEEGPLQSNHVPLTRCSMAPVGSNWSRELGSRGSSAEGRTGEGPPFSSGTLWGLAMKTLQNEGELGQ